MKKYAGITQLMQNISNETGMDYVALTNLVTGDYHASYLMFQKLSYWFERAARNDGMVYKTDEELSEETGVSVYRIREGKNRLREAGIDWEIHKAHGNPTTHYFINFELFAETIGKVIGDKIKDIKEYVFNFFGLNKKETEEKKFDEKPLKTNYEESPKTNCEKPSNSFYEKSLKTNYEKPSKTFCGESPNSINRTNQQNQTTEPNNKTNQPTEENLYVEETNPEKESSSTGGGCEAQFSLLRQYKVNKKKAENLSKLPLYDIQCAIQAVKEMDDVKSFAGMLVSVLESGSYKQPEKQVEEEEPDYKRYITGEWADFIEY
jgi:hypothetical protein